MAWIQVPCTLEKYPGAPEGHFFLGDNAVCDLSAWEGQVQCVYMDPPFMTGESFVYRGRVGEKGWADGTGQFTLDAFSDKLDKASYLDMLRGALLAAKKLLKETGALFLHVDPRASAYARLLCDEIFGERNFVNEIIWAYQTGGRSTKHFSRKHDTVLFYRMTGALYFDIASVPLPRTGNRQNHMRRNVDENGRSYRTIVSNGKTYTYYDDAPVYPGDVWNDVSHLQQKDPQRTGYDTQKPVALLERIIRSTTRPGDIVADLFCGSGTTLAAAAKLDRRYLGVDIGKCAAAVTARRLSNTGLRVHMPSGCPDAVLNAEVSGGIGLSDISLVSYSAPGLPEGTEGTDAVERWAAGFLDGDRFTAHAVCARSRHEPALPVSLQVPQLSGRLCILVGDCFGRTSCWVET